MPGANSRIRASRARPTIAYFLQGLKIGGMERGAIQLAQSARLHGYDARLVLYDTALTGGRDEYDPGDLPVAFVPRLRGVDPSLPFRLAKLLRSWNAKLIHARNQVAGFYAALALTILPVAPRLILTFDTCPDEDNTSKAKLASNWASRRSTCVSSVSADMSERLVRTRWVSNCTTLWNGVDTSYFSPKGSSYGLHRKLGLPPGTVIIGHVARLDSNKRQIDLLTAFERLKQSGIPLALVVAGEGPEKQRIEELAKSLKDVFLLGTVHDVPAFLRDIDVFALCSDDEGCPRALLEAMSCEKPVVVTAAGGVPEVVGSAGIIVPRRQPELLARAIGELCASKDLRDRLGRAARQRVLESFTLEQEWNRYEQIYKIALSR